MDNIIPTTPQKKPNTHILNAQAVKMLEKVLESCNAEKVANSLLVEKDFGPHSLNAYKDRTALYTGVSLNIIEQLEESDTCPEITLFFCLEIRRVLKHLFSLRQIPTCKSIYDNLSRDILPNYSDFANQLTEIGYENVKLLETSAPFPSMIMENPKITFERFKYIRKIMKARAMEKKIYYLSVKIYDENTKCMVPFKGDCKAPLQSDLLILYHIISQDGYENGLFSYRYDPASFFNWVMNILAIELQSSSLIVIENNPLCGDYENKSLTRYSSKKDMLSYLRNNNVPCKPTMHKAELFQLIEKYPVKADNNRVMNILKSLGHDVLLLPEHLSKMSPISLLWHDINKRLKYKEFNNSENVMTMVLIKEFIEHVISYISAKAWKNYDHTIKLAEEEFFVLDAEIENFLDKSEIDLDAIVCESDKRWTRITLA